MLNSTFCNFLKPINFALFKGFKICLKIKGKRYKNQYKLSDDFYIF